MADLNLSHTYQFSFKEVLKAYYRKYQDPRLSHVKKIDTFERYVDEKGQLVSTRLITTEFLIFSEMHVLERLKMNV